MISPVSVKMSVRRGGHDWRKTSI